MTLSYGFYNAINNDRAYDAVQLSSIFDGIITDGIFSSIGDSFNVLSTTGMSISIGMGRAWFNRTWTYNDSIMILDVEQSEVVLARIDTVVLEVDSSESIRANSIKIIKGTPGTTPVAPTLVHTSTLNQYPLADVLVPAGSTSVLQINITNRVGSVDCPFITGILESLDLSTYLTQLNAQFDVWFDEMKDQLSVDAAGNLQLQIDALELLVSSSWIDLPGNKTYNSKDKFSGIINFDEEVTDLLEEGYRISFDQIEPLSALIPLVSNANPAIGGLVTSQNGSPTYTNFIYGNGLTLNGTNQCITITDNPILKPTSDFFLGFIFKTSLQNTQQTLFFSASLSVGLIHSGINVSIAQDGTIMFIIGNNVERTIVYGKTIINDGLPHKISVGYRNNYAQIYVDGKLDGESWCFAPVYQSTNYIRIGCRVSNTGANEYFFNGQIKDFYFINGSTIDQFTIKEVHNKNDVIEESPLVVSKKGIITNIKKWTGAIQEVTFYLGTDYTFKNSAITNVKISNQKRPENFNDNENKWSIIFDGGSSYLKTTPTQNVYYLAFSVDIGIGEWDIECYFGTMTISSVGSHNLVIALSRTTNSISNIKLVSGLNFGSSLTSYLKGFIFGREKTNSEIVMNLIYMTSYSGISTIGLNSLSGFNPIYLRAKNALL